MANILVQERANYFCKLRETIKQLKKVHKWLKSLVTVYTHKNTDNIHMYLHINIYKVKADYRKKACKHKDKDTQQQRHTKINIKRNEIINISYNIK